jgi:hypothetical protein
MQSTYVADDEEEAYQFYRGSKEMLLDGSFNLRKFVTNSISLQAKINRREAETESKCVVKPSPHKQSRLTKPMWHADCHCHP